MPTKAEQYAQMADQVARQLTGSWQEWAGFLTTAARLYKYPFHEQLMIYAQRPDATACAEYDLWNNRMGRYVRRGSKGIALVDDSGDRPRLRYVFDISDTGTREHSRTPWLWTMNEEHTAPVMAMLERNYDVSGGDLAQQLADVAAKLAEEYWADHRRDILPIVDGSFLEEYDEYNIEVQFKSTAAVSITYALMSRCGLEPEQYFSHEDFMAIFDFNTPATVGALGTAVSQINQQVLRQIGVTIQNYERAKGAERSATHGKQPDLHEERRLPDPRPEAVRTAGEAPGQVRQDAQSVPEGTPAHPLQPAADEREAVPAPSGDRRDREQPSGADDAPAGGGSGRDGAAESQRPHAVGGPDEHLQGPGGGDPAGGTYQQLTLNLFLSEAEQIHKIDEAESVKTPSAFSMPKPAAQAEPVRRALTQAEIDAAIQEWNGNIESKHAVVRYMKDHAREKDTAAWLRQEYGDDLPALPVTVDGAAGDVPWPKVQRRIVQLIKEDRFYTEAEQDRFDNIDSIAIREALAERGIVNGQVVDPEKLDSDPFIRQVMRDVEAVATEEQAEAAAKPPVPDLSGQPVTREGDTLTIGSGEPTHEIDITVSDEEYAAIRGTIPERTAYDPSAPVYNVGNTVYLDDRAHQITELREDTVQLLPTGMSYPIYRVESRERFEQLLRADNRNDFYTEFLPVNPDTADQDLRDVLAHGLIGAPNKAELSELLRTGKSNREVALWLSRAYPDIIETMELETGDTADYRTIPEGIELEVLDADEKRLAMLFFRWDEVAPLLRGLYARQLDGFVQEQDEPYMEAPAAVEEPAETAKPIEEAAEAPAFHSETVAVYPGDKNGLPYDVVVERLHVDRPEPTPPEPTPDTQPEEKPDHPVAIPVNGEWQTFPNQRAAEQAAYQEYRDNLRRNAENFRITDDHLGEGGPKAKYQANVAAIKLLKYLEETTGQATPEQQEVLSRYVGWGGVADAFDPDKPAWDAEYSELKELLTPEKYAAARASTLNAHYTSPTVIRAIYEAVEQMGFRTGNILEPSCGVGNFFGMLPESMAGSRLYGVELDSISGRIAQQLYPKANITVAGFETTDRRDFYDLAIGNVPFGQYQVNDKAYNKLGFNIHNYFFAKALDQVRPGGVVAFVTSRYTMDAKDSTVRRYLAQRAELLGAIRLPNNAFRANAGTDVVSDILFLQKRDRPLDIAPDWTQTGRTEEGFTVNQYFLDHPEMVLGRPTAESTQYGKQDYTVAPIEGLELADQLHDAVKYIRGTYQEAALPELGEGEDIDESLPADPNVKNYSYTVVDGAVYFRENSRMVRPDLNATAEARVKGLVGLRDCVQRLIDLEMDAAAPDADIRAQIAELNRRYDDFSAKYGLINDRANRLAFADDSSYYLLCALEVLNAKETTLAAQKQQAIRDAFRDWIWRDPERRQALVRQYNEEMNATRPREYDGSHIVFGGMNPAITLREHQKNAIAHVLYGGNTLLAHEVGAGKTFEMVGAAMEAKRLGLCQKSLFVVPNHLTEQWASEFLRLYPSANILVTTKKDFEKHNRKKFCARIATGDYDAIIMGHSQFEKIPISKERQERLLHEQIWEITEGIAEVEASGGERFTVKQLERTKKSLEARLEKLQAEDRKDDVVTFEQLGVDRLFVDEAHNYKNLFLYTKMRNVAGLSTTDAQKSSDMFAKCRYMDEITGGRGVVFATGTPVSNSMTELYTMQRYLQYDRLQELGMAHFDCWASRFGETVTALELAPEGTGYRARTRFSKFFNLPELMNLFKEVADIKTADQLHLPTPEVEYHNIVAQPTEQQQEMVKALSERASLVHSGTVDPSQDNMLKITSDGRKLGLDQRIINQLLPDEPGTKVNQCVDNIMQIWRDGEADKLTQLVFCDISTPQARPAKKVAKALDNPTLHALEDAVPLDEPEPAFTVYEDIRQKLIAKGVPAEQIAFIHEANTEVRKKELFSKVRTGQVRVLLGSTAKMGAGTNVQDRLVALHDLDCPWRPGDLAQRKGRIERQGNQNETVHVYRYVTEGTFDAYLWQTVENKQKFISQIMTSKSPVRSCDDVDETALSFAEIKALCAGDPRIKERMDLDVDVARLKLMKADHQSKQYRLEDQLLKTFPEEIEKNKGFIAGLEADMATLAAHPHPEDGFAGMEVRGDTLTDKENAGAALLDACKEVKGADPVPVGSYRGFTMSVSFDAFRQEYMLLLKGQMTHRATLGTDPRGNLTRIDNALSQMPQRLEAVKNQLDNLYQQQAAAKAEVGKPFPQEQELRDKSARLAELDVLLNMDGRGRPAPEAVLAKSSRPSVLEGLKRPVPPRCPEKKPKHHEQEVR